jgi:hypothetical protein
MGSAGPEIETGAVMATDAAAEMDRNERREREASGDKRVFICSNSADARKNCEQLRASYRLPALICLSNAPSRGPIRRSCSLCA